MAVTRMSVAYVVQQHDGWALDLSATGSAEEVRSLFGTATLPLPLTSRVKRLDGPPERKGEEMLCHC